MMSDIAINMQLITSVIEIVPPMMLGALVVITLVIIKGNICPGQRGRLHKIFLVIAGGWAISSYSYLYLAPLTLLLMYYYFQVRKGKARESGPVSLLIAVNVLAFLVLLAHLAVAKSWLSAIALVLYVPLLGSIFAHLLLVIAATRLSAFHRILPVVGVVSAMLISLCALPYAYGLSESQLDMNRGFILFSFISLVFSFAVWIWHLLLSQKPGKFQLSLALLILSLSSLGFLHLFNN